MIAIKLYDYFTLELDGNLTTGYSWEFDINEMYIEYVDMKSYNVNNIIGSPSKILYTFRAIKRTNKTTIHMIYKRSWEKLIVKEYSIDVKVI